MERIERIERMKVEKADLEARTTKLLAFMESEEFNKLDSIEKRLLRQQYAGMETYLISLAARILREDVERYEKEIQQFNLELVDTVQKARDSAGCKI